MYNNNAGIDDWPYCFVCSRPTDHVEEHTALIVKGLARYEGSSVIRTELWDDELAQQINAMEFALLYPDLNDTSLVHQLSADLNEAQDPVEWLAKFTDHLNRLLEG